ncbi:HetZ-related protein 2 [Pannus brasiliensis CCIBt3594]|uniref:HetZ-related protein 2 n=1 Tax=Pannus brasiliensis CCIBt3594 TaxID=1427578 RepID=A0AAW9QZQ2_9CHRO
MSEVFEELQQQWHDRLAREASHLTEPEREAIVRWLLGDDLDRWETLAPEELATAGAGLAYRWQILQKRYLKVNPTRAYRHLLDRLGASVTLRQKIRAWVATSRDRQRAVADVLQEVIQEMLQGDRYIQSSMASIARYPVDRTFQNNLLFATLEEYALRPIRDRPLLAYRFVNYLRRQSKSGLTNVPREEMIRVLSDEIGSEGGENTVSRFDREAIAAHEDERAYRENQYLRARVKQRFAAYIAETLGEEAVNWFNLYLSGQSQESIARSLNLSVGQVYRLREKVGYHAIKVFALKEETEIVGEWLEITPKDHNFGLTPTRWESFYAGLTPAGKAIIDGLKAGKTLEQIAESLDRRRSSIVKEWTQLYLTAQSLRGKN